MFEIFKGIISFLLGLGVAVIGAIIYGVLPPGILSVIVAIITIVISLTLIGYGIKKANQR